MHAFLCADDSPLKRFFLISSRTLDSIPSMFHNAYSIPFRKTLMHFGTDPLTGRHIALSFGVGNFIDLVFMDAFVKCIAEDDFNVRPECHGFRIFLQPLVSVRRPHFSN
jgi:hypothetical protein